MLAWRVGALKERQFRRLWIGETASAFGDGMVPLALAVAVLDLRGGPAALGYVLLASNLPKLVFLLAGGVWADRIPRQRVMIGSDAARAGAHLLLAAVLLAGTARIWQLIAIEAVYGAADAFFWPAFTGLVPDTVSPERTQQANALLRLSANAAWLIAPGVAGILVATMGTGWVFMIDASTFLVSALFLARLRVVVAARDARSRRFLNDLRMGWRGLVKRRWLWVVVLSFSTYNVAATALPVLTPVVARRTLGGTQALAVISTGAAAGALLGGLVALSVKPRRPLLVGCLACVPFALWPLLLTVPAVTLAIAASALVGLGGVTFFDVLWHTAIQEHVPRDLVSRVSAYDSLGSFALMPVGYAAVGVLATHVGLRPTLMGAASLILLSAVAPLLVGDVRRLPRGDGAASD